MSVLLIPVIMEYNIFILNCAVTLSTSASECCKPTHAVTLSSTASEFSKPTYSSCHAIILSKPTFTAQATAKTLER